MERENEDEKEEKAATDEGAKELRKRKMKSRKMSRDRRK